MGMGSYTLGTAKTALAAKLGDGSKVFWTDTELGDYLLDSLRTFNAHAAFYRERAAFNTVAGTAFYDLRTVASSTVGQTLTTRDLVRRCCQYLLEPTATTTWLGSAMFTLSDVVTALNRRRQQFLLDTGHLVSHATIAATSPPVGRLSLPATLIDVRRVAWIAADTTQTLLYREDEWGLNSFLRDWASGTPVQEPYVYSVSVTPPLQLQLAPLPAVDGTLDLLSVDRGTDLDASTNVLLGLSDDLGWVIVWGALADLLAQDGPAQDLPRAAYCQQRWADGCQLARAVCPVLMLQLSVNDVPITPDALIDLDQTTPGWMNVSARPDTGAVAGWNLLALSPVADAVYGISADLLATVPAFGSDLVSFNLPDDLLDVILNYAVHLASFKCGAAAVLSTQAGYTDLVKTAALHNERLRARAFFADVLGRQVKREETLRPRRVPPTAPDLGASATGGTV